MWHSRHQPGSVRELLRTAIGTAAGAGRASNNDAASPIRIRVVIQDPHSAKYPRRAVTFPFLDFSFTSNPCHPVVGTPVGSGYDST